MASKLDASDVLVSHHNVICNVLNISKTTLISLTGKLFEDRIVDRATKIAVMSKGGYEGADTLLDHVETRVDNNPELLHTVLEAMRELEALKDVVEQMDNWKREQIEISIGIQFTLYKHARWYFRW